MPNLFPSCHLGGFGLGALNDADEDDLDVYDAGPGLGRDGRRIAYDDDEDGERIVMGSSNKPSRPVRC